MKNIAIQKMTNCAGENMFFVCEWNEKTNRADTTFKMFDTERKAMNYAKKLAAGEKIKKVA